MTNTTSLKYRQTKEETINWVLSKNIDWDYAITLTFPVAASSKEAAERLFGTFMTYVNKTYTRRRSNHQLTVFAVLEGNGLNRRYHYHLSLKCPLHIPHKSFVKCVLKNWRKVNKHYYEERARQKYPNLESDEYKNAIKRMTYKHWSNQKRMCDIKDYTGNGWIHYICKDLTHHVDGMSIHSNF